MTDFRLLLSARLLFTLAVQMQAVLIGWHMYDLTRSALYLGFIGLAEAVPALSLALFAGYIVDKSRPIVVYRLVIATSLLSAVILLISQQYAESMSLPAQISALFASSFVTGLARAFSQPAMFAIVPRIIPRESLSRSSAWLATSMQVARISGPALGGLLFGWFGIGPSAAVVCGTLLLAMITFSLLRAKIPAPQRIAQNTSVKTELLLGAKFVFGHPILLPALSLDMLSVLFGGVTALLPIFASEILMIGPKGLGLLRAAPAVGAVIMSYWLTRQDIREGAGRMLLSSVFAFGICILVFALSSSVWLSAAMLALSGAFDSVSMVIRSAAVQLISPDAIRGRISAINSMFIGSSNELGELESGLAAHFFGTVPAVVIGAVVCIGTVVSYAIWSPALRQLNLKTLEGNPSA